MPDISVCDAACAGPFDVMILPGGLGGTKAMADCEEVGKLLKEQESSGRKVAAICAGYSEHFMCKFVLYLYESLYFSSDCFKSSLHCKW